MPIGWNCSAGRTPCPTDRHYPPAAATGHAELAVGARPWMVRTVTQKRPVLNQAEFATLPLARRLAKWPTAAAPPPAEPGRCAREVPDPNPLHPTQFMGCIAPRHTHNPAGRPPLSASPTHAEKVPEAPWHQPVSGLPCACAQHTHATGLPPTLPTFLGRAEKAPSKASQELPDQSTLASCAIQLHPDLLPGG